MRLAAGNDDPHGRHRNPDPRHPVATRQRDQIVVQVSRLQDGTRKVMNISEVLGVEDDRVNVQDIFAFERVGVTDVGKVHGRFTAKCDRPRILERFRMMGVQLDSAVFTEALDIV
jgi:pilus assembly protein CpaF